MAKSYRGKGKGKKRSSKGRGKKGRSSSMKKSFTKPVNTWAGTYKNPMTKRFTTFSAITGIRQLSVTVPQNGTVTNVRCSVLWSDILNNSAFSGKYQRLRLKKVNMFLTCVGTSAASAADRTIQIAMVKNRDGENDVNAFTADGATIKRMTIGGVTGTAAHDEAAGADDNFGIGMFGPTLIAGMPYAPATSVVNPPVTNRWVDGSPKAGTEWATFSMSINPSVFTQAFGATPAHAHAEFDLYFTVNCKLSFVAENRRFQ